MVEFGCERDFVVKALEPHTLSPEFDRSMWLYDITRDEAMRKLEGLPHGAFLVRPKTDKRRIPYVLSIV